MTGQLQFPEPVQDVINEAAGKRAKQEGMARIGQLDPEWAATCDAAIRTMARRGIIFQAADLVTEKLVPEPPHPNCWGPRFSAAAKAGVVEAAGYAPSKRATVHGSACRQWIGTAATRAAGGAA